MTAAPSHAPSPIVIGSDRAVPARYSGSPMSWVTARSIVR